MASTDQLYFFCGRKNLKSEIIQILLSYYSRYGNRHIVGNTSMCRWFSQLPIFCGRKNLVRNYSNFTIIFPTIWRCTGDYFKVFLKFKMAAMDELHNFLWVHFFLEIVHIFQSHHPPSGNVQVILLKFKMANTTRLFKYLWPQKLLT